MTHTFNTGKLKRLKALFTCHAKVRGDFRRPSAANQNVHSVRPVFANRGNTGGGGVLSRLPVHAPRPKNEQGREGERNCHLWQPSKARINGGLRLHQSTTEETKMMGFVKVEEASKKNRCHHWLHVDSR